MENITGEEGPMMCRIAGGVFLGVAVALLSGILLGQFVPGALGADHGAGASGGVGNAGSIAAVDRIEGEMAVLIFDAEPGHPVDFPRSLLPCGADEGDLVEVTVALRPDLESPRRARLREMLRGLLSPW